MDRDDGALLDRLRGCRPAQFEQIVSASGMPADIISPNTVPLATRATELLEWARQSPDNEQALRAALDRASRGSSQICVSADWNPPLSFALLIGRQDQEDLVEERLVDAARTGTRVVTFVLPGCPNGRRRTLSSAAPCSHCAK